MYCQVPADFHTYKISPFKQLLPSWQREKLIFTLRQPFVTDTPALTAVGGAVSSICLCLSFTLSLYPGLFWMRAGFCDSSTPENTNTHIYIHTPVAVEWQQRWSDRDEYSPEHSKEAWTAGVLLGPYHSTGSLCPITLWRPAREGGTGISCWTGRSWQPRPQTLAIRTHWLPAASRRSNIGSALCQSPSLGFSHKGFNFNSLSSKPRPRDGEGSWLTKYFYQHWNCSAAQNGLKNTNQQHWPKTR